LIQGFGPNIASRMPEAGFLDTANVRSATDENLAKVMSELSGGQGRCRCDEPPNAVPLGRYSVCKRKNRVWLVVNGRTTMH
jgi:hypothetical protein